MVTDTLTHFDKKGRPRMVDVSDKASTARRAIAEGKVILTPEAYETIRQHGVKKGDIRPIAEIAGIMGAKKTADLIPLCHPLPLTGVDLEVEMSDEHHGFVVTAHVKTAGKTGVEMEALTAVSVACLTIYDMAKAVDKTMVIEQVRLLEKTGGKSGDYKVAHCTDF